MSIRTYTDIIIYGAQFLILERKLSIEDKQSTYSEGLALETLNRIEEVMRKGFTYSVTVEDNYSKMARPELMEQLKIKAASIRDGYLGKSQQLSCVRRFFGDVAQKEQDIRSAYERIENLASPPPVLGLPNELIQHIAGFLQAGDLGKLAQVNKHGNIHVKKAEVQRAQEYGYKGSDLAEAKDYLKNLFQAVETLVKDGYIPEEHVVRRGKWPFWRYMDSEATFRNIKYPTSTESKKALEAKLNIALLEHAKTGKLELVRLLLLLGADPNIPSSNGSPPLHWAAQQGHAEVVALLLKHGARVADPGAGGNTALCFAVANHVVKKSETQIKETVKVLLEAGADANTPASNGSPPLHWAAQQGHAEVVELLLQNESEVDGFGRGGYTAMAFASEAGNESVTKLLLLWGADTSLLNHQGKTALELAKTAAIKKLLS